MVYYTFDDNQEAWFYTEYGLLHEAYEDIYFNMKEETNYGYH